MNRPGVGRTTLGAERSFHSVAWDVSALLDALGLQRVVFMGASGGGPYATACACLLPERTAGLVLVAGMTHTRDAPGLLKGMALGNRQGYLAINHLPWLMGPTMRAGTLALRLAGGVGLGPVATAARAARREDEDEEAEERASDSAAGEGDVAVRRAAGAVTAPPAGLAAAAASAGPANEGLLGSAGSALEAAATSAMLLAAGFSPADRAAVARAMRERPELMALMAGAGSETLAQGLDGLWRDMRLTSEPWGLDLGSIRAPTVVWQGDQDFNVTVPMARHLAAAIPGASPARGGGLRVVPGEGHISLGLNHGRTIMEEALRLAEGGGAGGAGGVLSGAE
ncbi:hypothetical protein HYH03_000042 [Edaphochlamys debaryana]|uniref:AB hydrolase-1 domain-containing protein n=1 Tax=Edaphochlamys debaryana TaxID=47281 RepID=A0A836C649_9CHLO|nr:hypothetical protein HYH03_000042 [Edaphochlamys debaryana]|eukprot:KAG2501535.1 hypothetical protein HYH03_000042 [Edaphochlamys debaryana]